MSRDRTDLLIDPRTPGDLRRPERLFYAQGVLLSAEDFAAEQTYHRGRLARALAYLHGTGTVAGLRVVWEPAMAADAAPPDGREERLRVEPGLAIDSFGRLIELDRDHCLRLGRWFDAQSAADLRDALHPAEDGVVADLFLRFVACEREKTPAFADGALDATDSFVPSRLRDDSELILVARSAEDDLPVPPDAWPDPELPANASVATRRRRLEETLLDRWSPTVQNTEADHYPPAVNPSSVLLARLVLPATPPAAADEAPARTDADVDVDNFVRRFVYPTNALARWVAIE